MLLFSIRNELIQTYFHAAREWSMGENIFKFTSDGNWMVIPLTLRGNYKLYIVNRSDQGLRIKQIWVESFEETFINPNVSYILPLTLAYCLYIDFKRPFYTNLCEHPLLRYFYANSTKYVKGLACLLKFRAIRRLISTSKSLF